MSVLLICGDGSQVRLPKRRFEKLSLFNNPVLAKASSYTLECKARPQVVNLWLDLIDSGTEVTITNDHFDELRDLCREMGFSGLDKELRAFEVALTEPPRQQI